MLKYFYRHYLGTSICFEKVIFPLYASLHALQFVLFFKKKWETTEILLYSTFIQLPFFNQTHLAFCWKNKCLILIICSQTSATVTILNCRVTEEPFIIYVCCVSTHTTSCQGNKTSGNKGQTLRQINTVFSKPLVQLTTGPASVTTAAVSSSFVSCWESREFLLGQSEHISLWHSGSVHGWDLPRGWWWYLLMWKVPDTVQQPARSIASPDTANKQLCRCSAHSHAETDLDTLPPNESWARRWARGYVWDKAFFSERLWFGLFFSVLQNNREGSLSVSIFDALNFCFWCCWLSSWS